jgi:hypothetical protein
VSEKREFPGGACAGVVLFDRDSRVAVRSKRTNAIDLDQVGEQISGREPGRALVSDAVFPSSSDNMRLPRVCCIASIATRPHLTEE